MAVDNILVAEGNNNCVQLNSTKKGHYLNTDIISIKVELKH